MSRAEQCTEWAEQDERKATLAARQALNHLAVGDVDGARWWRASAKQHETNARFWRAGAKGEAVVRP